MKPYEFIDEKCLYGKYDTEKEASYVITDGDKLVSPWYYIYQNRKILVYVDQNGPVKIQHRPPSGILIVKRELGETQSKLQTWITCADVNGGIPFSNFNNPVLGFNSERPVFTVKWSPSVATYISEYPQMRVETSLFVPIDKATLCIKTKIVNKLAKPVNVRVTPSVFPYINKPQMVAWDLPEWYLTVRSRKGEKTFAFCGKMRDPDMNIMNERSVTYNTDYVADADFELDMSKFALSGNFFSPHAVTQGSSLSYKMKDSDSVPAFKNYQSVFAADYKIVINANDSKTFTQVLTVQENSSFDEKENLYDEGYFNENFYNERVAEANSFYHKLFTERRVKTDNKLYNNFINAFAPLQMYWVGSLDRGWPSSMRGSRDASQDFIGIVPLYPSWARQTIKDLLEHQRTDGWMPRQVSTISRGAPHDMRNFSDGGAFLLELVHVYLSFTRDFGLLKAKVLWLDSDEESTVMEHVLKTIGYYLAPENIGEHGLCKVWYGDWWDVMDKIGVNGRGESVSVTAQTVLNLKNLADMITHLAGISAEFEKYLPLKEEFLAKRNEFVLSVRKSAFNKLGYYNGYFNDDGKWLLSDEDPDGRERLYLVSNAWAIISGCANEEESRSVLDNVENRSICETGYATKSIPFYDCIKNAGRAGLGGETVKNSYNHAQSFYVRACCAANRPDLAYHATRYILPIEEKYAPVEKTFAPPFAIANMYGNSPDAPHRVSLQYLSGTVSYVLRTVYEFFFGIVYRYDGLLIRPCLPEEFGNCSVEFRYLGKNFKMFATPAKGEPSIKFNGKSVFASELFIPDGDMSNDNLIEVEYRVVKDN